MPNFRSRAANILGKKISNCGIGCSNVSGFDQQDGNTRVERERESYFTQPQLIGVIETGVFHTDTPIGYLETGVFHTETLIVW